MGSTKKALLIALSLFAVSSLWALDSDEELAQDRDYYPSLVIHNRIKFFLESIGYNSETAKGRVVIEKDIYNIGCYSPREIAKIDNKLDLLETFLRASLYVHRGLPLKEQEILFEGESKFILFKPFYTERNLNALSRIVIVWDGFLGDY